jgi:hypothetical protein
VEGGGKYGGTKHNGDVVATVGSHTVATLGQQGVMHGDNTGPWGHTQW